MSSVPRIRITIVTKDLFFESRITGAVQASHAELQCVSEWIDHKNRLADDIDQLIVVDLSVANIDQVMTDCRNAPGRHYVIGFAPHVHKARLEAARAGGFHETVSQGQVESRVRELVSDPMRIPFGDETN